MLRKKDNLLERLERNKSFPELLKKMGHTATLLLQPATAAPPCANAHFTSDRSCQMQTLPFYR